jgi:Tol biopolymer transport system component
VEYPQVWLLHLAAERDKAPPVLELVGDPAHQTLQPEWSLTGLLAFYDTQAEAYLVVKPGEGEVARFSNQTGQSGAWQPDGQAYVAPEILYLDPNVSAWLTDLQSLAGSHLFRYYLDGSKEDLTQIEVMEDTAPVFSLDGEYLAFARKFLDVKLWTPGRQLWLMNMTSGETSQWTNAPLYNHYDFAWSPRGDQLAYVRFNQTVLTEPPEIWLIDIDTRLQSRLVQEGYAPQWVP